MVGTMAIQMTPISISLELGRLKPVNLLLEAGYKLVKQWRHGGSDLATEEDLVTLLGRGLLARELASSFLNRIKSNENRLELLFGTMGLMIGPGPTVQEALREGLGSWRFSMVVQCSLLVTMHNVTDLAGVIAEVFRQRDDDRRSHLPAHQPGEKLSAEDEKAWSDFYEARGPEAVEIALVLKAIRDQTSEYDWSLTLRAVAGRLGFGVEYMHETIPRRILECMLLHLPQVTRDFDSPIVTVDATSGTCAIVAWAHSVLGLSVLVALVTDQNVQLVRFGDKPEQVCLRVHLEVDGGRYLRRKLPYPPIFTLLHRKTKQGFELRTVDFGEPISQTMRGPTRGFAKRVLLWPLVLEESQFPLQLSVFGTAIAWLFAQHLKVSTVDFYQETSPPASGEELELLEIPIDLERVLASARLLFDDDRIDQASVEYLADLLRGKPFTELLLDHEVIARHLQWPSSMAETKRLRRARECQDKIMCLGLLIISWSQVLDLQHASTKDECAQVLLAEDTDLLQDQELARRLISWDGQSDIEVHSHFFFWVLRSFFDADQFLPNIAETMDTVALVSNNGFSIFLPTLADNIDPSKIEKGTIRIKRGVPFRDDIRKRQICDDHVETWYSYQGIWRSPSPPPNGKNSPDWVQLDQCVTMTIDNYYCGTRGEDFLVRFHIHEPDPADHSQPKTSTLRRTGYSELYRALWTTVRTQSCRHPRSSHARFPTRHGGEEQLLAATTTLPAECKALLEFGDGNNEKSGDAPAVGENTPRIYICLTAASRSGSSAARWRALVAIEAFRRVALPLGQYWPVLLRCEDCCYKCAVEQVCEKKGKWFLVL